MLKIVFNFNFPLQIHPLDIIKADNIRLKTKDDQEASTSNPSKAFKDF